MKSASLRDNLNRTSFRKKRRFKISYEEVNHYIYASNDPLRCFIGNLEGRTAKSCKNIKQHDKSNTRTNNQACNTTDYQLTEHFESSNDINTEPKHEYKQTRSQIRSTDTSLIDDPKASLTRRVYYLRDRDFAQILGHVFGSENTNEATVVDPNALKNLSYEDFEFYF